MTAYERWARHLRVALVETIAGISAAQRSDVYVIRLMLESEDDDNRRVIATVDWNTVEHLRTEQASVALDEGMSCEWFPYTFADPEARVIGTTDEDVELRTAWLKEAGLWYEDEDADLALTDQDEDIWDGFVSAIVDIAQRSTPTGRSNGSWARTSRCCSTQTWTTRTPCARSTGAPTPRDSIHSSIAGRRAGWLTRDPR